MAWREDRKPLTRLKLRQLRSLAMVAQSDLSVTSAAAKLHTTQPAVSKHNIRGLMR
jgi:DNA-binding transcriptional LysR family regulator